MGTKLLKLSPVEVRGYRDPVAYFFGYDSDVGSFSVFELNADTDDLFSIWLIQWSITVDQAIQRISVYSSSSYGTVMPLGETSPLLMIVDDVYINDAVNNLKYGTSYVNPRFCGWKKANTKFQLTIEPTAIGGENTIITYVRGYIYRELPDRI